MVSGSGPVAILPETEEVDEVPVGEHVNTQGGLHQVKRQEAGDDDDGSAARAQDGGRGRVPRCGSHTPDPASAGEKKQAERQLRESEERYRSIFDNSALLIQSCDPQGKFIFANPAWLETLGYSELELQAMNVFDVIHPRSTEHCQQIFQCITAGEDVGTIEVTFRTRQGEAVEVRGKVSTQLADGQVVASHAYFEDVTETKKMEQQLLRAQRLETIGSLASGVAHDLNNVLSPIMMSVQILRQKMPDEQSKKLLSRLEANVKRGASIIKQVLTFARGGEGERSTVQVRHLMKDVAAICEETFPKSVSLSVDVARDPWPVSADATQLHQVLMNLCINARDAMPDGGSLSMKAANVDITQERTHMGLTIAPGSFVVVTVSDSGTGIDEEELEQIFEPFYTTKEVGKGHRVGVGFGAQHRQKSRRYGRGKQQAGTGYEYELLRSRRP